MEPWYKIATPRKEVREGRSFNPDEFAIALEQAKGYVEALGATRDVIVTDGIRYRMYEGERGFAPVAYANLARLKQPAADLFTRMQRP